MSRTAFVLGGGGLLGAVEVGMLRALGEHGIRPDLVLGTSVGAINGLVVAADPETAYDRLVGLWRDVADSDEIYADPAWRQMRRVLRSGTHLHDAEPLQVRLEADFGTTEFADLAVQFQCCAASIERVGRALVQLRSGGAGGDGLGRRARAAAPGRGRRGALPRRRDRELDPGRPGRRPRRRPDLRAAGRPGRPPAEPPRRPWEVARVSFEIARRHRFVREMRRPPRRGRGARAAGRAPSRTTPRAPTATSPACASASTRPTRPPRPTSRSCSTCGRPAGGDGRRLR